MRRGQRGSSRHSVRCAIKYLTPDHLSLKAPSTKQLLRVSQLEIALVNIDAAHVHPPLLLLT